MPTDLAVPSQLQWAIHWSGASTARADLKMFGHELDRLPALERSEVLSAMDEVQVRSKLWLIDELRRLRDLGTVQLAVLGAWYGILPLLFNWRVERPPRRMTCIDIDPKVVEVGRRLIGSIYGNIHYECADVMNLDYEALRKDPGTVVINTICEHLPDLHSWWNRLAEGQFVVLQSNNYFACPDHISAVRSLDELKQRVPLSKILFEGVLPLSIMDRYMVIGYR
jgi:SAM-dependent methyltransferase